jgi:predicted ribosomally synthesized peptide with SipW-like signal peptide
MEKILRRVRQLFFPAAFIFIAASFTGAYFSDTVSTTNNTFTAGTWTVTPTATPTPANIVINEFMANPVGSDESNLEWVELYNTGGSSIDINGWVLYDSNDAHDLPISSANVAGGSTVVGAGGYVVVGRNGDADFSLNNSGDSVRLYDGVIGVGNQIESSSYLSTIEDRTWSRLPDGTGAFTDGHVATPGGSNV